MATTRSQKVARVLRDELSRIIRKEINDPRLGMVSITDIDVSPDLKVAEVFVSALGESEQQQESIAVLQRASGFLRGELSREINMRYTPELRFKLDTSLERGVRVLNILDQLQKGKQEDKNESPQD